MYYVSFINLKTIQLHELDEVILPTKVEEMVDEFMTFHNKGLKRVRTVRFPNTKNNMDWELDGALFVTYDLLEAL